jgi:hypothetical protein
MKKAFFLFFIALNSGVISQTVEWNRSITFTGSSGEPAKSTINCICADNSGNVYVGGCYQSIYWGARYIPFIALYNSSGQQQWLKADSSFSGSMVCRELCVQGGSLYVVLDSLYAMDLNASNRRGIDLGCSDMAIDNGYLYTLDYNTLKKRDLQGNLIWSTYAYGYKGRVAFSDAGFIYTRGGDPNIEGCPLMKFDTNGNLIWSHGTGNSWIIAAGKSDKLFKLDQASFIKTNGKDSMLCAKSPEHFVFLVGALTDNNYIYVPEWDTNNVAKLCIYEQTTCNFISDIPLPVDSSPVLDKPRYFNITSLCWSGNTIYAGGVATHEDSHHAYFSKISSLPLSIKTNNNMENDLLIYPNPSKGKLTISYENLDRSQLSVRVLDIRGCCVHTESVVNENSSVSHTINLEHLGNGFYLVEFKDEKGAVARKKLVIQ